MKVMGLCFGIFATFLFTGAPVMLQFWSLGLLYFALAFGCILAT